MKKILLVLVSLAFAASVYTTFAPNSVIGGSGNCILCSGGGQCRCNDSSCSSNDTKECKKLGCKRSGTSSCSTAANVKKYR